MDQVPSNMIFEIATAPDAFIEGLFSPECILPTQIAGRAPYSGEERLLLAVLEDAIRCFFGDDSQARTESILWFRDRDGWGPFTFENICEVLGLDAGWFRRGLFRQRALLQNKEASDPGLVRFSRAA